jgi:hypothetical protein
LEESTIPIFSVTLSETSVTSCQTAGLDILKDNNLYLPSVSINETRSAILFERKMQLRRRLWSGTHKEKGKEEGQREQYDR